MVELQLAMFRSRFNLHHRRHDGSGSATYRIIPSPPLIKINALDREFSTFLKAAAGVFEVKLWEKAAVNPSGLFTGPHSS
jgi:hypothetical protein